MAPRKSAAKPFSTTTTTKIELPVSSNSNNINLDTNGSAATANLDPSSRSAAPSRQSPYLPTPLETLLIALYPLTLLLGSIYSALQPTTTRSTYNVITQSYDPSTAPSYFAKKTNIFNVYFVKIGWLWATAAFLLLTFTHPSLGAPLTLNFTRRRRQALLRYSAVTLAWIFVTQWFFGPAIIDRSYRWTGGQCGIALQQDSSVEAQVEKEEWSDAREALTHAACKAIGGTWAGGHDISGHVFLLILTSAMLWLEFLPAVVKGGNGGVESRQIVTSGGLVRSATIEAGDHVVTEAERNAAGKWGVGVQFALGVTGLSWWMLFMTAAFFHTWFEKLTGLLVAFTAVYVVYCLPRAVPALRAVLGMPGV